MKMQSIKRYEAYKDSGVEWLGDVPAHWDVKRLKETIIGSLSYGANESALDSNPLHPRYIRITDFSDDETLKEETYKSLAPDVANNYLLKEGDILFARSGATAGKTFHFKNYTGQACYAGYLIKARPKKSILLSDFLSYFTKSFIYGDWRNSIVIKATIENISAEKYGFFLFIPTPSIVEQTAIAAYLDTQTAQIDRKIDLLSQKAVQYDKLKQSLINETVIRGLDKTVTMKDSGIEWIGEVPVHWEAQRIGTAFEERSEKVNDTDYPPLSVSMGGIVPQMDSVAKTDHNDNRKRVAVGDYVINSRSDRRGASGISIYDGSVSVISIVLAPRRSFFGKYLHHLFRSYSFIEEFYRVGRGIVDDLWTTRYSVMKGIEFAYPSYEEQQAIANYLDEKTAQIDRIIATINSQIDKLKELRKKLINDVVTGKIKVA
jgi:type I restriction enzyme S subunit